MSQVLLAQNTTTAVNIFAVPVTNFRVGLNLWTKISEQSG